MRNPVRSEAEAFSFVIVVGLLALAVGLAAWLGGGWVALGVFLALALGLWVGLYIRGEPKSHDQAVWERRPRTGARRRILVIANETVAGQALCDEIRYRARGADDDVLVVAPALSSQVRYWASDIDGARSAAQERLDASLRSLASAGVRATGEIGDGDPLQALEDALRAHGADEVIISTHPRGRSNWLERDVVMRARELYDLPITHVVVDLDREAEPESTSESL